MARATFALGADGRGLVAWLLAVAAVTAAAANGPWAEDVPPGRLREAAPVARVLWQRQVDLPGGPDLGQHLATLFEVRDARQQVLAAAGFVNGAQSGGINDHRSLHVFVAGARDARLTTPHVLEVRPYNANSLFRLTTWRGDLLAYSRGDRAPIRRLDALSGQWQDIHSPISARARVELLASLQAVAEELLGTFTRVAVWGDVVVPLDHLLPNKDDFVESSFYFGGRLLISAVLHGEDTWPVRRQAVLIDCAWQPPADHVRDCRTKVFIDSVPSAGRRGYSALGMHGLADGRVLIYGLDGFLYQYAAGTLSPLVEIDPKLSWQVYSSLEAYGDVLLGHYPSANLVRIPIARLRPPGGPAWEPEERTELKMRPTVVADTERLRDEAQSLMRLGRDLAVGVWPWGEVFTGRPGGTWSPWVATPLASLPHEGRVHPYEGLLGNNCMGMRVFQLVPWRGGIAYQTTVKNMDAQCAATLKAVAPALLEPYGRVAYLDVPGLLSCPLPWTGRPRRLQVALTDQDELVVSQDGLRLCSRPVPRADRLARELGSPSNDTWVRPAVGLYGRPTRLDNRIR